MDALTTPSRTDDIVYHRTLIVGLALRVYVK